MHINSLPSWLLALERGLIKHTSDATFSVSFVLVSMLRQSTACERLLRLLMSVSAVVRRSEERDIGIGVGRERTQERVGENVTEREREDQLTVACTDDSCDFVNIGNSLAFQAQYPHSVL